MKNKVFNTVKTSEEYKEKPPLFLGDELGLFDTINKHYPKIWSHYKNMKSLDWSEDEFDYSQCNIDFKNCPKPVHDMMIRTLAWQWEADSVASRAIAPLMAPVVSDTSLWTAWQRISDNESIHAATYSEIVRMSFDDPEKVLQEILAVKESIRRLDTIKGVLDKMHDESHKYALGKISKEEIYPTILATVIGIYMMERIQFPSSFSITFTICGTGIFQPIGKAVQKIAQDELEVHVEFAKEIIKTELATERGRRTFEQIKPLIQKMFDEIVQTELTWNEYLFSEGRELVGANLQTVNSWTLFCAAPVHKYLSLNSDYKFPRHNPMVHLENWLDIGKVQAAPQEQDNNQYKVGAIVRNDDNVQFDVDF